MAFFTLRSQFGTGFERQQVQPGEALVYRGCDEVLGMQGGERRYAGPSKCELAPFAAQLMDHFSAAEEEASGEIAEKQQLFGFGQFDLALDERAADIRLASARHAVPRR